ncbi:A/G-specific adenine glycosylase [Alkalihalobacillus sp. CinArs1]|uniref:A/G-specific adenine glycosylase n=1 Tax=Alkalihalobacillus sp. CinArs1 TaxID=2995314 RepID=UPI0022DD970E|nr:A/G-specific adenine glycosylase [Alkalihalobacillus sp. CinArs1]
MTNVKELLHSFEEEQFQNDLIDWFRSEQRILPWRENKDPYRVWVSEIMLQQTRVDTVIPYFHHFLEKFPTVEDLANAPQEEVLKAWEGLGYYSRARNLQAAVKEVAETYGGVVPNTPSEISKLKGVGPYTAGAILSIAYGVPEPAVDGNVMRVISRIIGIWEDIAKPSTRKIFEEVIREIISKEDPSSFNQGLMELGAIICTPKSPSCLLCPVQSHCRAFHEGSQEELPIKSKKKAPRPVPIAVAVFQNSSGRYLIRKRPEDGLLAGLWEFVNVELTEGGLKEKQLITHIRDEYGGTATIQDELTTFTHVFSHIKWYLTVYKGEVDGINETETVRFVNESELEKFAFPVAHQKIVKQIVKGE